MCTEIVLSVDFVLTDFTSKFQRAFIYNFSLACYTHGNGLKENNRLVPCPALVCLLILRE
jgi:hypothetical protein